MRVLLLNPPFIKNFMRNARWAVVGISGSEWYPIYLGYCTGLLERWGHHPKLLDAQNRGFTHEQTYQIAKEFEPELLVLYFSTASLDNDIEVGKKIKDLTGCQVVMVGPWASIYPKKTLKKAKNIDMLAEGEFDFTVLEIAKGVPKSKIKGLYYKKGKKIIKNPPRLPVPEEELDKFPFVTDVYRRHLNIWDYHQTGHQYPFVDLFTGRGCSWGLCTFCLWPNTINKGAGYRKRSIENVIEELRFIKREMPYIKEVFFQDDTLPKERAIEISEAIIKNNLKICWSGYSRANLDFETLKLMKRAGCRTLHVGYESGDLKILQAIRKGTTPQMAERFTYDAAKAGIFIVADFITGLPHESVETIKKTTEWARRLPVQRYTITLPKPYPMTPFYNWLKKNKYINQKGEINYPNLSWEEINKWNRWSLKRVYFSWNYFIRMITEPYEWGRIFRSALFFIPYLFSKTKQIEYGGFYKNEKYPSKNKNC